ncbi:Glycerol-3-phosphate acyltransferase [Thalictrum thalictroides]|uniref:Glycerol-3-phosphate acyltransferase n=1 Tax=Thalictrum thalictroides TaxID=46969 RepID=A0A7J6X4Z7_THATH|nr:Glycerol-3-phosphate acyltransferase [Thalictrum thalictroides]
MAFEMFPFKALVLLSRYILRRLRNPRSLYRKVSSNSHSSGQFKLQKYPSLNQRSSEFTNKTLVFDVENTLLKSTSLFSYFMLVAFEAGGIFRALFLLLLYPFICFVNEEMGVKMMVMVCFFGIKKDSFRVGRAVLPKFFLEDVGFEGFEVLMKGSVRVGVSVLPRVMVESFLKDYLEIEFVVGRELKVCKGYYVGLMEEKDDGLALEEIIGEKRMDQCFDVVGVKCLNKPLNHDHLFSHCKDIYTVSEAERRNWHDLPKEFYPKPLIFHDGRLAIRPTPFAIFAVFMWVPFATIFAIFRIFIALTLPYKISTSILAFSGLRLRVKKPNTPISTTNGLLYVCNHRTLLDPLYLSTALGRPLTAVTYSLSRMSEIIAPIKTVRLTRDRQQDSNIMEKMLSQGDLVVCPEGTTCREPYLLRFSPLFAEMKAEVVPVAMDAHVSMFHGTTASGLKCLDPLFFLMNPFPSYNVEVLNKLSRSSTCRDDGVSSLDVANQVQKDLGDALGFECTKLTRKDKYLILAGNEGIVKNGHKS